MKQLSCLAGLLIIALQLSAQLPDFVARTKQLSTWEQKANIWQVKHHAPERLAASGNYDVKYHRCEWKIDPGVYYISGCVTTYFEPTAPSFSEIDFDFSTIMRVDSVKYHGSSLSFSQDSGDVLAISLPSAIGQGTLDSVSVYYQGAPAGDNFGAFTQTTHNSVPILWTVSEPYGAKDWWPCKQALDDKIDSIDIYVTCPQQYRDGSNGVLVSETQNGLNKTYHWKSRYPIAAYLVAISVTNYSQFSDHATLSNGNSLQVLNYVYPEDSAMSQAAISAIVPIIELYDSLTIDYPFANEKYGHCEFSWGGGMEHQTMTYCTTFDEFEIAHECAHQWFGDKVTCGSWQDVWLNEGFATYFEGLSQQYLYPANWQAWKQDNLSYVVSETGGSVMCTDTNDVYRIFDPRLSYSKGAYVLHMLRWKLGDAAFFAGLKSYLTDPNLAYGYAKTSDLKTHLESASGQDLTNFFNEWYYNEGYPTYNLRCYNVGRLWNVTIKQTQSHPSVSFFEMPVPVELKDDTHDTTVVLNNTYSGQSFAVSLSFAPTQVILDPQLWLLHANDVITKIDTVLISTSAIDGSPLCPKASLNVSFNSGGNYNLGNVYTAQISNAAGSFTKPTSIGTLTSNTNYGTIAATLPVNLAAGTSYRIRVVSSSPVVTGMDNGSNLTVKTCGAPTGLTASSITKKSAVISWTAVDCAYNYKLQYRKSGTSSWTSKFVTGSSYTILGLLPSTTYEYELMTLCTSDGTSKSAFTSIQTFTTTAHKDVAFDSADEYVNQVTLYPNPAKTDFVVEISSNTDGVPATITMYSMLGEKLYSQDVIVHSGANTFSLQASSFPSGLYLIMVQMENEKMMQKLTISK